MGWIVGGKGCRGDGLLGGGVVGVMGYWVLTVMLGTRTDTQRPIIGIKNIYILFNLNRRGPDPLDYLKSPPGYR